MGWLQNEMAKKKLREGRKNVGESFAGRCRQVMSMESTYFETHFTLALQFNSQATIRNFTKQI